MIWLKIGMDYVDEQRKRNIGDVTGNDESIRFNVLFLSK